MDFKLLREKACFTQKELASVLGLRQGAIAMWETGKSAPKTTDLPKIAEALKVTVEDIVNCFSK